VKRLLVAIGAALCVDACGSSTSPTPVPPPTPDPPQITCPAPQSVTPTSGTSIAVTYPAPTTVNGQPPVGTVCTPASGSVFNVGITTVVCTATDALQRTASCSFPITVVAPVTPILAATTFVAFGDSITRGEDGVNGAPTQECSAIAASRLGLAPRVILPDSQTYPGVLLQTLVARYTRQSPAVDNRGCPGEAVTDSTTFPRFVGLTSSRRYDAVLLMEGSNDLMLATKDSTVFPAALAGLKRMVDDAKSRNVRPLIATIPPMNPAGSRGQDWGWNLVPAFNSGIRGLALDESIPLVDVNAAFNGNLTLLGADGLHPTAAGYQVIAGAFADAIRNNLEIKAPSASILRRR
jgi:lysophospholipase L1-like esterase